MTHIGARTRKAYSPSERIPSASATSAWHRFRARTAAALAFAFLCVFPIRLTAQQAPPAIYAAGNAAVTGFSGALPPIVVAPGSDPDQQTFIDLNGPSLRIIDLQHMDGLPRAQLVGAPKPFTFSASQLGQVFAVTLDDSSPPNIYAAATSVYGLPIVTPDPHGQLQHVRLGAPNATFMPGLWGPGGGPGSIWKIDGRTGQVSLFANVTLDGRQNTGAALGGLAYDPESKSLYVADRETGFIHRFALDGHELGRYDHGVTGRASQGLPPVPWTPHPGVDVTSPQFDSTNPATWDYAAPARRVFGLAVYRHRLYYAVADSLQIWSVGLKPDGSFADDAVIELVVPPSSGPTEISKITFDEQGRMFLAERPAPTGAFDFRALAVPAIGRVLRYAVVGMVNGRRVWQQQPNEYAIGFPQDLRNGNGGVAIGYNYDSNGDITHDSCGGFMWTTGERLREPSDVTLATELGEAGPLVVDGLQGNGTWRVRPDNEPPMYSYFIDYDDQFLDEAARGHMGDIAIALACSSAGGGGGGIPLVPPLVPPRVPPKLPPGKRRPPPPGSCPPGQVRRARTRVCGPCQSPDIQIGGRCCVVGELAVGKACSNSSCPIGQTAIGPSNFCCDNSQVYTGANGAKACCTGKVVNGHCERPPPPPKLRCVPSPTNPHCCPQGYVSTGKSCCLGSQMTSTGVCCPAGQTPSGPHKKQCKRIVLIPMGPRCCPSGQVPTANGACCPPANVTTSGVCCPGPVDPKNRAQCKASPAAASCPAGYTLMPNHTCCRNTNVSADGKSCRGTPPPKRLAPLVPLLPHACPRGTIRNRHGRCVRRRRRRACPPGTIRLRNGACVLRRRQPCPLGMVRTPRGSCVPLRIRPQLHRPRVLVPSIRAHPPAIRALPPSRLR